MLSSSYSNRAKIPYFKFNFITIMQKQVTLNSIIQQNLYPVITGIGVNIR